MTEVKFELFAKKKDDPSEPKPLRIHKGELYHKPNEFGIDVETCNQDVSVELVITPKGYKEARAIGLGCTRIKPIKRTRKRQIAKAKHMMACHDHTSYEWSQWWHSKARKPRRHKHERI